MGNKGKDGKIYCYACFKEMQDSDEYYWNCEYCGKEFEDKSDCDKHEQSCKQK